MEIINKSSRLIRDVRSLRQIRNGSLELKKIDAGRLLTRAIAECTNTNGTTINCPTIVDSYVMANEMLGDAFSNIIANICEFRTPQKVIDINAARIEENGQQYVKFIFEDNGPGIPEGMKKRMMSDTWEQHGNTVRKSLGPKFARSLVEAYRGQFWIEDRVFGDYTKGVRFVVKLPAIEK